MKDRAMLPLATPRLVLRALRPEDAAVIHGYRNDPGTARYQDWSLPFSMELAEQLVSEQAETRAPVPGGWIQLGVEHEGELIGDLAVGLDRSGTMATIGYTLHPDRQGSGFGTEAVGAIVDELFTQGVVRVVATVDPENQRSARLLERVGFRYDGRAVGAAFVRGVWVDDDRYAITAAERRAHLARGDATS